MLGDPVMRPNRPRAERRLGCSAQSTGLPVVTELPLPESTPEFEGLRGGVTYGLTSVSGEGEAGALQALSLWRSSICQVPPSAGNQEWNVSCELTVPLTGTGPLGPGRVITMSKDEDSKERLKAQLLHVEIPCFEL